MVKLILDYLKLKGHYVWRNNTGATRAGKFGERFIRYGLPGSADILGIEKGTGRFIAIECKTTTKTTALQDQFLNEIKQRGGIAIVAYDLADVEKYL